MKLLIAIPTLDFMHFEFVRSLTTLIMRLKDECIDFDICYKPGTLVYVGRDLLVNKAIEEGFTHTLWLDADMVFNDDILDDLLWCEKPYVCGVFHSRRPPFPTCIFSSLKPVERVNEYPTSAFEIAGSGFGCVLIETDVFRQVKKRFPSCFLPDKDLGEDLAFCQRVHDVGIKMYCEPTARVGHVGHIAIYPEDEERWRNHVVGL